MIQKLIPKEFQPLLEYISPSAFKVIDWRKSTIQFFRMSKSSMSNRQAMEIAAANHQFFDRSLIEICESHRKIRDDNLSSHILDIYFSQFFSKEGVLLDLRLGNFSWENSKVKYKPANFFHKFEEEFRLGMLKVYKGFYLGEDALLEDGMFSVGLVKETSQVNATKDLLFAHFGNADHELVQFDLAKFRQSFHELFLHLKKNDIRLSSDFLFLGMYLVTLYLAQDAMAKPLDVKKIFTDVLQRNGELK